MIPHMRGTWYRRRGTGDPRIGGRRVLSNGGSGETDGGGDRPGVGAGLVLGPGLDHHPDHWLRPGGTHQDSPPLPQSLLGGTDRRRHRWGGRRGGRVLDGDALQDLGEPLHRRRELTNRHAAPGRQREEPHSREEAVPGGGLVEEDHMPRLLPAERGPAPTHLLEYVPVADLSLEHGEPR